MFLTQIRQDNSDHEARENPRFNTRYVRTVLQAARKGTQSGSTDLNVSDSEMPKSVPSKG